MTKVNVYNIDGNVVGEVELNPTIFEVSPEIGLIHRAVVAQMANKRRVIAHTKDRGEVRGGGRKPWRQKGTGRARHGSIRSPLWRGGGVVFGPTKERVYQQKINKKERRKALFMVLTDKVRSGQLILLDKLELPEIKTKKMAAILNKLPNKDQSTLIVLPENDQKITRSAANIPYVSTIDVRSLNVVDLLKYKYLLLPVSVLKIIEEFYKLSKDK
jgi:large subunit ribosomal protein L4